MEAEFISSLRSILSNNSDGEVKGEDAVMVVSYLAEGPSFSHYDNDRSDCRLLLILRGQNSEEFPLLEGVIEEHQNLITTPVPLLRQEAKRRMDRLPRGKRWSTTNMSGTQAEKWLSANPVSLEENEKPFFQLQLNELAESLGLADAQYKDFKFKTKRSKKEKHRRNITRGVLQRIARFFKRRNKKVFALDARDEITVEQVEAFRSDPDLFDGLLRDMERKQATRDTEDLIRGCDLLLKVAEVDRNSSSSKDPSSTTSVSLRQAIVDAGGISVMAGLIQEKESIGAKQEAETPELDESGNTALDESGYTALEEPGQEGELRSKACDVLRELARDKAIADRIIEEFGGIEGIRSVLSKRCPASSRKLLMGLSQRPERVNEEDCSGLLVRSGGERSVCDLRRGPQADSNPSYRQKVGNESARCQFPQ